MIRKARKLFNHLYALGNERHRKPRVAIAPRLEPGKFGENWVAIVTGGASGIGKSTAESLCKRGARVAIASRDEASGANLERNLLARGYQCISIPCDIRSREDCDAALRKALQKWGRIDSLIANAAIRSAKTAEDATLEDWTTVFHTNVVGASNICAAALPALLESRCGSIVLVSSINATIGRAEMDLYDASKAALLSLMRSLAARHAPAGLRVNAVCPGYTLTDYHFARAARNGASPDQLRAAAADYCPLGRAAEPHEIAAAISFLAGPESSFITGQALHADGGLSTLAFDRRKAR